MHRQSIIIFVVGYEPNLDKASRCCAKIKIFPSLKATSASFLKFVPVFIHSLAHSLPRAWLRRFSSAQIDKLHALDDALSVRVQARNDAVREAHCFLPVHRTKFETPAHGRPDFSG